MSLIDEVRSFRQRVVERLQELEPLVQEYQELKRVAAELGIADEQSRGAPTASPASEIDRVAAPRTAAESGRARSRAGASHSGASRARAPSSDARRSDAAELGERVLAAVRADPGKTVADYAGILGITPTQLYRPVRELTTDGALVKRARQLYPS